MEKHRCKLCLKSFANGRALGGHMRSHMMNLYVPPKSEQPPLSNDDDRDQQELGFGAESVSSSDADEEEENEEKELLGYGLRENPKKSIRLVDPEFSFAVDGGGSGSVVLQDRESETESSKNPIRRRSKRIRKSGISEQQRVKEPEMKKPKSVKVWKSPPAAEFSPWAEAEPVSSISDTTPDEDVAYCLMMLSRDKWRRNEEEDYEAEPEEDEFNKYHYFDEEEEEEEEDQTEEDDESELKQSKSRKGKYKCETCNKVFRSYQALGGHRASHKKNRAQTTTNTIPTHEPTTESQARNGEEKIHQCPVCYRVFSSGQALGGHKRSHVIGSSSSSTTILPKPPSKFGSSLIDLNLPAPIDEDDESSQVSDAEFVNPSKK